MAQFRPEDDRPMAEASTPKLMFYVYLLKSLKNNKSYIGFTSKDPKARLREHNEGTNRFTKENGPWRLIYYESFLCQRCAKNREQFLKTGVGKKLRKIIVENFK